MVLLFGIFGTSFVIALSGALMPGPVLTVTISESSRRGFWAGPLIIVGHGILELALVILLLLGLGPYLSQDIVFGVVGLLGALILMWMALSMFRSIPSLKFNLASDADTRGNPVWAGILMSLANPYWIIWWATIGLGYIVYAMKFGAVGVIAFFAGHISADFAWYSAVSLAISKGRSFISDRLYKGIIAVCASALVVFGGWFGFMSIQKFVSALVV
ncbi:MAG: LysE family transporter [Deltaproteobacteria bacterium]|nr:LysE family transporter [Deltaproteobacteria bacterium]MBW2073411.1 LysE family transporter [Deltaproteobacteria bacterium]RLB83967.1 MAG: lysine transporter LysE [Deltaproteobacteria bacterium]